MGAVEKIRDATASALAKGRSSHVRWFIFILLLLMITANYIDRASISVAMPLIAKDFSLSPSMQGVIMSGFFLTYAIMQIPGGMLADRFGPRVVIAVSTAVWGLFEASAGLAIGFWSLLVTRFGLGVAEAPIYPAGGKLNGIWMTPSERGRGATLLDGGAPLGSALGAVIITFLITAFHSWRAAFVVAGVLTVMMGVWSWFYVRNHPSEHRGVNAVEAAHIEAGHRRGPQLAEAQRGGATKALGKSLAYRSTWAMFFGWMFFNTLFYGTLSWMPTYFEKVHHLDLKQMGGAVFIMFFCGFVGELVGGWIADAWRSHGGSQKTVMRTMCGIAAVLTTLSIFAVTRVTNITVILICLSSTLFFLRWCGLYWAIPSILGRDQIVGALGGFMNLGGNIAGVFVPIAVGVIFQITGRFTDSFFLFTAAGIGLFLCSSVINKYERLPV